jgi:hypothetical protein
LNQERPKLNYAIACGSKTAEIIPQTLMNAIAPKRHNRQTLINRFQRQTTVKAYQTSPLLIQ